MQLHSGWLSFVGFSMVRRSRVNRIFAAGCFPLFFAGALLAAVSSDLLSKAHAQADLPQGPGRVVLERMCTGCHGLNVVTGQRMTKKGWAGQVDDMVSRGAVGSGADIRDLVDYLAENFGKEPPAAKGAEPDKSLARPSAQQTLPQISGYSGSLIADAPSATTGVTFKRLLNANQEPWNWLTFGGTYRSLHNSSLHQITPENAKNLELKWVFQARWLDPYETTPLVVNGVLYTMQGDDVVALDATTGRLFWIYRYTPESAARLCCGRISRGLAILGETLYMAAVDAHLIAIDAQTGTPLWNTTVASTTSGYTMSVAPLVVKNEGHRRCGRWGIWDPWLHCSLRCSHRQGTVAVLYHSRTW